MTSVILKPHKEESLKRFHPWVFSGAIARIVLDADHTASEPEEGELVCVRSAANETLGVGHWQIGSIAVRILAFGVDQLPADFWQPRIRTAYHMRVALGLVSHHSNIPSFHHVSFQETTYWRHNSLQYGHPHLAGSCFMAITPDGSPRPSTGSH
jgi:23S rRNA G2069 N7-methylase RlmK/C1962 C5-methylase RlmI